MRKSLILDALLPKVRAELLAATFGQPSREWFLSEIAGFLQMRPSSLQREVDTLSKAGILSQRRDGRRIYLKPNQSSPVYEELKSFFDKTAGMLAVIEDILTPFGEAVPLAFVHGSVARSNETSASDVDLMIVGLIGLATLVPALREAERRLGRPVNPTVYSAAEFKAKYVAGDHFLSTVLAGKIQFVRGDKDELDTLLQQG